MSRSGWSTRALKLSPMLVLLGLVFSTARAQQPDATQVSAPSGQESVDQTQISPSADPPTQVGRLSVAQGNVSVEPASVNQFSPADVNYPLTTGDRLWTDYNALAEVQGRQLAVRMAQTTDLTVTAMTDTLAQFGLGQGSVHLRTYALAPGTTTELDTPNVAVTVLATGDVRVDVDPTGEWTVVTVFAGVAEVDGNGLQQTVGEGQSLRLSGANPVSGQWVSRPQVRDALDTFSSQRDQAYEAGESAEQSYLNADTVGGAELQQYGSWQPEEDYGSVWFPASVPAGWQPYCYGRWTWVAPWGWTWIEAEAWGFAPFHYGRWAMFGGRWGWVPGPPVVHPVYAPALVVFVHPGGGATAWFPLGPNEPYAPWYHSSTLYLNRVNASNLYNRNFNQVREVYDTENRNVYVDPMGPRRQFENRAAGTVAVSQASFASGQPVRSSLLHLEPAQLFAAPMIAHPMVTPERAIVAPARAHAFPARLARPALASHQEQPIRNESLLPQVTSSQTSGPPAPVERRGNNAAAGTQAPNQVNQIEYRNSPSEKSEANQQAGSEPETHQNNPGHEPQPQTPRPAPEQTPATQSTYPNVPVHSAQPSQQAAQPSNPNQPPPAARTPQQSRPAPSRYPGAITLGAQPQQSGQPMTIKGGETPTAIRGTEQLPQAGAPEPRVEMQNEGPQQRLYNRAVPPPTRPSFDQQRQAIQNTDPGRPLSPQQLDNLRENRPVGAPQMHEAVPHPAPTPPAAPRSEPAPQRSGPPPRSDSRH
jgi:hypothetical protein